MRPLGQKQIAVLGVLRANHDRNGPPQSSTDIQVAVSRDVRGWGSTALRRLRDLKLVECAGWRDGRIRTWRITDLGLSALRAHHRGERLT